MERKIFQKFVCKTEMNMAKYYVCYLIFPNNNRLDLNAVKNYFIDVRGILNDVSLFFWYSILFVWKKHSLFVRGGQDPGNFEVLYLFEHQIVLSVWWWGIGFAN